MYHALTCIDNKQLARYQIMINIVITRPQKKKKKPPTITRFNVLRGAGVGGWGGWKVIHCKSEHLKRMHVPLPIPNLSQIHNITRFDVLQSVCGEGEKNQIKTALTCCHTHTWTPPPPKCKGMLVVTCNCMCSQHEM